jgi:hypothetical protein
MNCFHRENIVENTIKGKPKPPRKTGNKKIPARRILIARDIALRDLNWSEFAELLSTTSPVLNRVIDGKSRSERVAEGICAVLDYSMSVVFPEYHPAEKDQA